MSQEIDDSPSQEAERQETRGGAEHPPEPEAREKDTAAAPYGSKPRGPAYRRELEELEGRRQEIRELIAEEQKKLQEVERELARRQGRRNQVEKVTEGYGKSVAGLRQQKQALEDFHRVQAQVAAAAVGERARNVDSRAAEAAAALAEQAEKLGAEERRLEEARRALREAEAAAEKAQQAYQDLLRSPSTQGAELEQLARLRQRIEEQQRDGNADAAYLLLRKMQDRLGTVRIPSPAELQESLYETGQAADDAQAKAAASKTRCDELVKELDEARGALAAQRQQLEREALA